MPITQRCKCKHNKADHQARKKNKIEMRKECLWDDCNCKEYEFKEKVKSAPVPFPKPEPMFEKYEVRKEIKENDGVNPYGRNFISECRPDGTIPEMDRKKS